MFYFNKYTERILDKYKNHIELIDSIAIGFTGAASERLAPIYTSEVNTDTLFFAAAVNFANPDALVRIKAISPQYEWMANNDPTPQDTPINAIAGVSTQALPILPIITPFFVKANGRLQMIFTNSANNPTTGGVWTWRRLKLIDPIEGGWDYSMGVL
jgi:hypothetical protein